MHSGIDCGAKVLCRSGMIAMTLAGLIPAFAWGQEASLLRQPDAAASRPFTAYDDTLARAADTVLATAAQATHGSAGTADAGMAAGGIAGKSEAIHGGLHSQPWGGGLGVAAARVDLLRPAVEPILRSHGVPADLMAVILVESGGRADALSSKGARGLWQLMPDTARRYGLRVDDSKDERFDLLRATDAAARYLHDLYAQFGDWKLALAAYNTGEAHVGSAIARAHTQDFDQLIHMRMLPLETRDYVPRVLATAEFFGQSTRFEKGAFAMPAVFAVSSR